MLLLPHEPHLGLAEPGPRKWSTSWIDAGFAWSGTVESLAFKRMALVGYTYGYHHPNDAQNDAARGVIEALRFLRAFEIYLIAERLT